MDQDMKKEIKQVKDFSVMVVDDEVSLRKVLVRNLKLIGYKTYEAGNGNEALEVLDNNHVDLIITDVRMPEADGVFLLEKVMERESFKPQIVLVTGCAEITREEATKKGALDLLDKPINLDVLEKYIEDERCRTDGRL